MLQENDRLHFVAIHNDIIRIMADDLEYLEANPQTKLRIEFTGKFNTLVTAYLINKITIANPESKSRNGPQFRQWLEDNYVRDIVVISYKNCEKINLFIIS